MLKNELIWMGICHPRVSMTEADEQKLQHLNLYFIHVLYAVSASLTVKGETISGHAHTHTHIHTQAHIHTSTHTWDREIERKRDRNRVRHGDRETQRWEFIGRGIPLGTGSEVV